MKIYTSDYKRSVDVGTGSVWNSVYSTAATYLSDSDKVFLQYGLDFLKSGKCAADDTQITARQMELIQRRFAKIAPMDAVWDMSNPSQRGPWHRGISSNVTSCANLYTTANGKDLFLEIISLLKYAAAADTDVLVT